MMKETGSEFWTETHTGAGVGPLLASWESVLITLCGRTALEIIVEDMIRSRGVRTVYMPSYCCHTMIEPFLRHGLQVVFYDVFATEEGIKCHYLDNACDVVFLIDYFGFVDPETRAFAERERRSGKIIVYDRSHSLFCTAECDFADYALGSFRKWFGVNAGFAAKSGPWTDSVQLLRNERYTDIRNRAFDLKAQYISGAEPVDKTVFLRMFGEAEEMLEKEYSHYGPDCRSVQVLETVDVNRIRSRRRENAACLMDELRGIKELLMPRGTVGPEECPLFVPVCTADRDGLRRSLIGRQIYCPAHWPVSEVHQLNEGSRVLYDTEMSVVCDQRYGPEDMKRIAAGIREYMNDR